MTLANIRFFNEQKTINIKRFQLEIPYIYIFTLCKATHYEKNTILLPPNNICGRPPCPKKEKKPQPHNYD